MGKTRESVAVKKKISEERYVGKGRLSTQPLTGAVPVFLETWNVESDTVFALTPARGCLFAKSPFAQWTNRRDTLIKD